MNNRIIENTFTTLNRLYDNKFNYLCIDNCSTINDLYSLVISNWILSLAKEGLHKEYVTIENEEMSSPVGNIDINETINRQSKIRGNLVCNYDELSNNIYINKVLRYVLEKLLILDINKDIKINIRKTLTMFNGIDTTDKINKKIHYNNDTVRYKKLIEFCNNTFDEIKRNIDDEIREYLIYKKQFISSITKNSSYKYNILYTSFDENTIESLINKKDKYVVLYNDKKALVIFIEKENIKKNSKDRQKNVLNKVIEYNKLTKRKTFGALVLINTDYKKINIETLKSNVYEEYTLFETTIDIFDDYRYIDNKIKDLIKYFNFY